MWYTDNQVQGPYVNPEDIQQNQRLPAQIVYEAGTPRAAITGYPPQHPPHTGGHHPHMPQWAAPTEFTTDPCYYF